MEHQQIFYVQRIETKHQLITWNCKSKRSEIRRNFWKFLYCFVALLSCLRVLSKWFKVVCLNIVELLVVFELKCVYVCGVVCMITKCMWIIQYVNNHVTISTDITFIITIILIRLHQAIYVYVFAAGLFHWYYVLKLNSSDHNQLMKILANQSLVRCLHDFVSQYTVLTLRVVCE